MPGTADDEPIATPKTLRDHPISTGSEHVHKNVPIASCSSRQSEYGRFVSVDAVAEPTDPERCSGELTMLTEFLDFYRTVLLRKASGLTDVQLTATVAASTLTIGQLIRHMTLVEDHWFDETFAGRPEREPWASADWDADRDWEMTTAHGMSFADLHADFDEACKRSRDHLAAAASLDVLASGGDTSNGVSLRWIVIHMIEEYARHCGHADILRESIDGRIGD